MGDLYYFPGCSPHVSTLPRATLTEMAPGKVELVLHGPWEKDPLEAAENFAKAILIIVREARRNSNGG